MKRWWIVIALLLSLGVNIGILATLATRKLAGGPPPMPEDAPPPPPPHEEGAAEADPFPRVQRLADRLGLEGEQRRRFLDIQQSFREETVRIRMHLAETQREVRRELMAPEPDRRRIDELLRDASRDFLVLEQALARNVVSTREILTPEQEREYLDIVSRMRPPEPGRFGPPRRGPGRFPGRPKRF